MDKEHHAILGWRRSQRRARQHNFTYIYLQGLTGDCRYFGTYPDVVIDGQKFLTIIGNCRRATTRCDQKDSKAHGLNCMRTRGGSGWSPDGFPRFSTHQCETRYRRDCQRANRDPADGNFHRSARHSGVQQILRKARAITN